MIVEILEMCPKLFAWIEIRINVELVDVTKRKAGGMIGIMRDVS